MRSDLALHAAVATAVRRILGAGSSRIGITVHGGAVCLSGDLDNPDERSAVAGAVHLLDGVRALAIGIAIVDRRPRRNEAAVERDVLAAVEAWRLGAAPVATVHVEDGWVTIAVISAASAIHERDALIRAARSVAGVRGVTLLASVGEPLTTLTARP